MIRALLAFALLLAPACAAAQAQPPRQPLLVEGTRTLVQRVILRPGATLHARPDAPLQARPGATPQARPGATPQARPGATGRPAPGFAVLQVYARQPGWIEVGRERPEGWVREEHAIPWRHTMIAAFTNPAGRERALFVEDANTMRGLLAAPRPAEAAAALRARAAPPLVALEPEVFVDISRNFYLLPILEAETFERPGAPPARILEILSAPAELRPPPDLADPALLRDFRGAVVFVIDSTISMQPYIDRTRDAVRRIIARIGDSAVRENFRFGMVEFRADTTGRPQLEFVARLVAPPDLALPPEAVLPAIERVRAAPVPTAEFDEDAIAGIKLALDGIDWAPFGGRYIVLITDAGALTGEDAKAQTRLGIPEIRALAESRGTALFAIHLLTPEGARNHARAAAQYRELTRFGAAGSLYFPVPRGDPDAFAQSIGALTENLFRQVAAAVGRPVGGVAPPATAEQQRQRQQVEIVATAMRLAHLGRAAQATAPDVVRSFTTDRDFRDPMLASLDIRVLLTRNQLSDLSQALTRILDAGLAGRTDPQNFFAQLRAAFAATARDPRQLGNLARVGEVLGEYLQGLPYQSQLLELTEGDWLAMGAAAQRELVNGIEAKLRLYQEYAARPDLWVSLDGRPGGEAFFPVPLDALP